MFLIPVTEDISLQLVEQQNADELFNTVDESREYLREWLPWVDKTVSAKGYEPVIAAWLQQFADHNGFQAGIYYKGDFAGMAGFHGIDRVNQQTSIGYWLAEKYQGLGIMTAVVKTLLSCAFDTYELNRVEIKCGVKNKKSRAIPERLGFIQEGIIRDGEYLYDHFHDIVLYSMLASEWEKQ